MSSQLNRMRQWSGSRGGHIGPRCRSVPGWAGSISAEPEMPLAPAFQEVPQMAATRTALMGFEAGVGGAHTHENISAKIAPPNRLLRGLLLKASITF